MRTEAPVVLPFGLRLPVEPNAPPVSTNQARRTVPTHPPLPVGCALSNDGGETKRKTMPSGRERSSRHLNREDAVALVWIRGPSSLSAGRRVSGGAGKSEQRNSLRHLLYLVLSDQFDFSAWDFHRSCQPHALNSTPHRAHQRSHAGPRLRRIRGSPGRGRVVVGVKRRVSDPVPLRPAGSPCRIGLLHLSRKGSIRER